MKPPHHVTTSIKPSEFQTFCIHNCLQRVCQPIYFPNQKGEQHVIANFSCSVLSFPHVFIYLVSNARYSTSKHSLSLSKKASTLISFNLFHTPMRPAASCKLSLHNEIPIPLSYLSNAIINHNPQAACCLLLNHHREYEWA